MDARQSFDCLVVRRDEADELSVAIETKMLSDLPSGNVLIEVAYSSLNYKDALACQAHPGIVRNLPHVPGIDAAGIVIDSSDDDFRPGDSVLVTGYDLGTTHWGGYSRFVRVPAEWIVATPEGIDAKTAMTYGTAGFTAAQCVSALLQHGVQASAGPIVVTGASGGVGSLS
ncbi:MAG: alcohol dehydrogenase catalytic domain-containing protein, partial [Planctomycetota bacterium]